jgi:hypothetical protein
MTDDTWRLVRLAVNLFVSVSWLLWLLDLSSNVRNRR